MPEDKIIIDFRSTIPLPRLQRTTFMRRCGQLRFLANSSRYSSVKPYKLGTLCLKSLVKTKPSPLRFNPLFNMILADSSVTAPSP